MKPIQILLLFLLVLTQPVHAQSSTADLRDFSSEGDFVKANSVRLPKRVLSALLATNEAEAGRDWVRDHPGEDTSALFNAFPVNLSTAAEEKDWVAVGKWEHLSGADNNWFWIVRSTSSGPHVVLFCSALTVGLLPGVHDSLHDIRCSWESPGGDGFIDDYRFNGQRYLLTKDTRTHRRP